MVAPRPAPARGPALRLPLLLLLLLAAAGGQEQDQTTDWRATLKTIRNGIHKIDTYLNAALDLLGGEDGLCQYKCRDGSKPLPRYGFKLSPPNGCGSPLFGVHLNIGIPSLTKCCNQHDRCYETCGKSKNDCDEEFQYCLSKICRDVQKTLGLAQNVQGKPVQEEVSAAEEEVSAAEEEVSAAEEEVSAAEEEVSAAEEEVSAAEEA